MTKKSSPIYPILLLIAAMIWGFAFVAQGLASGLGAFTIGGVRNVFATVFLLLTLPITDKLTKNGRSMIRSRSDKPPFTQDELKYGALCGGFLTLASVLQQTGINLGSEVGIASFITALYVVMVPIFALLFGKRSGVTVYLSAAVAIVGFYLLCVSDEFSVSTPDILVLLGAVTFSVHILSIDRAVTVCDGTRVATLQFAFSAVYNWICVPIFERNSFSISAVADAILPLLFLGIGSSGIAYTLQIIGQKGTPPAAAALILSLESVFGVIGAVLVLGDRLSVREYIGCAVVFLAVVLAQTDITSIKEKLKNKK